MERVFWLAFYAGVFVAFFGACAAGKERNMTEKERDLFKRTPWNNTFNKQHRFQYYFYKNSCDDFDCEAGFACARLGNGYSYFAYPMACEPIEKICKKRGPCPVPEKECDCPDLQCPNIECECPPIDTECPVQNQPPPPPPPENPTDIAEGPQYSEKDGRYEKRECPTAAPKPISDDPLGQEPIASAKTKVWNTHTVVLYVFIGAFLLALVFYIARYKRQNTMFRKNRAILEKEVDDLRVQLTWGFEEARKSERKKLLREFADLKDDPEKPGPSRKIVSGDVHVVDEGVEDEDPSHEGTPLLSGSENNEKRPMPAQSPPPSYEKSTSDAIHMASLKATKALSPGGTNIDEDELKMSEKLVDLQSKCARLESLLVDTKRELKTHIAKTQSLQYDNHFLHRELGKLQDALETGVENRRMVSDGSGMGDFDVDPAKSPKNGEFHGSNESLLLPMHESAVENDIQPQLPDVVIPAAAGMDEANDYVMVVEESGNERRE